MSELSVNEKQDLLTKYNLHNNIQFVFEKEHKTPIKRATATFLNSAEYKIVPEIKVLKIEPLLLHED